MTIDLYDGRTELDTPWISAAVTQERMERLQSIPLRNASYASIICDAPGWFQGWTAAYEFAAERMPKARVVQIPVPPTTLIRVQEQSSRVPLPVPPTGIILAWPNQGARTGWAFGMVTRRIGFSEGRPEVEIAVRLDDGTIDILSMPFDASLAVARTLERYSVLPWSWTDGIQPQVDDRYRPRNVRPLVYIAGPFRAKTSWEVEQNVRAAEQVAHVVATQVGAMPVCPHTNTRHFNEIGLSGEFWLDGTMRMLRTCDAVMLTSDWVRSSGARAEVREAYRLRIPVFDSIEGLRAWMRGGLPDFRPIAGMDEPTAAVSG